MRKNAIIIRRPDSQKCQKSCGTASIKKRHVVYFCTVYTVHNIIRNCVLYSVRIVGSGSL